MSMIPLFLQDPKNVGLDWLYWDGADLAMRSELI